MDIQYLLFLQNLRLMTGGIFDEFFNGLSKFAVDILVFLPFVIYWAADKKWANRMFATYYTSIAVNSAVKLTVCAYRPWIRSDAIQPAGDSKTAATGYSFPSGHTTVATALYGTTAVYQWTKRRWLSIVCIAAMLLTGFSRNFLGVHTPQDVCVGCCETLLILFAVMMIYPKVDGNDKLADIVCIAGVLFAIAVLIYVKLKPYPMDYVDGKLLVDPQKMMSDAFKDCGVFVGFCIANLIDRRFIHYEIPFGHKALPVLTGVGLFILFAWKAYFCQVFFVAPFGPHWGNFFGRMMISLFGIAIYPLIIMRVTKAD